MTIQQSHFRIRNIGALQTINQDSDWAQDLDVNSTLNMRNTDGGCLFGLRFELEEIISSSTTVIPKLQYRVNLGSWTDCEDVNGVIDNYNDPGLNDDIFNVIVTNKATITDGAATTNILGGSGLGFVAGTGEHDTVGASITLNNQHTEIEWRVLIRNRYTTRQESVTGDEYEFRVVESDNTPLGGTYVIPKITINLPDGYMGGTGIETSEERSYVVIPDGTMYTCLEEGEQNAEFTMMKSIDGGNTWLQQDATVDLAADMESLSMVYDDTNKVIHVAKIGNSAYYYQYATKDHATETTDAWITAREVTIEAGVGSNNQSCDIILRGSNIYVFYGALSSTDQIWYRKKADLTTGSFASRVSVDTSGGSTDFTGMSATLGPNSDLIHIFYTDYSNFVLYHVSLNTSDVLGTRHTCDTNLKQGTSAEHGMTNALSWYNGSVEKAIVGYKDETNDYLYTVTVENDGAPDTPQNASNSVAIEDSPAGVASKQPVATLGIDPATDEIYAFYALEADQDLWMSTSSDGAAWTGHTEVADAVMYQAIRGSVFTHSAGNGGDTVFGWIWDTAYDQDAIGRSGYSGTNRYDEFLIAAGGTDISDSQAAYAAGGINVADRQVAYAEGATIFPFTEDFSVGGDGDEWSRGNWVTASG